MDFCGAVLGVDAAWTEKNPSGVALAVKEQGGWRLAAVAPSYRHFCNPELAAGGRPAGSAPDGRALIAAAKKICGRDIDLAAADMPMSRKKITGRRTSDNAVSSAYGARKCGTHSPTPARPGLVSEALRRSFEDAGYLLQTQKIAGHGLIEVYPHPALVELSGAPERHPYKAEKIGKYWKARPQPERRARLIEEWARIISLLDAEIDGVRAQLPLPENDAAMWKLKAFEDMLDAVICAWTAVCALEGKVRPFGDEASAIWIPAPSAPGLSPGPSRV